MTSFISHSCPFHPFSFFFFLMPNTTANRRLNQTKTILSSVDKVSLEKKIKNKRILMFYLDVYKQFRSMNIIICILYSFALIG